MHFECVARDFAVEPVHQLFEIGLGHDAPGAQYERFEQGPFARGQVGAFALGKRRARAQVDIDVAEAAARLSDARAGAPAHGAQSGAQFLGSEGLDQVVVGTGVQARDPITELIARGEHQRGSGVAAGASRAHPLEARAVGQLPIHQPGVKGLAAQRVGRCQALAPVHAMALGAQEIAQAFTQDGVVFDQQKSHM